MLTKPGVLGNRPAGVLVAAMILLSACGGPGSPFRVGELPPVTADSDLDALHRKDPRIPLPDSPQVVGTVPSAEDRLYAPRPYLISAGDTPENTTEKADRARPDRPSIALTLPDTVLLGLRHNKSIRSAYLARVAQKFSLYVSEEEFVPRWQTVTGSATIEGGQGSDSGIATLGTDLTWNTPFGTRIGLALSADQFYSNAPDTESNATSSVAVALNQPLLRGAGKAVNTADLRLARIEEQQDKLLLRSSVTDTVSSLIVAYFSFVRQQRNLQIARRNLERSRKLLASNERLVAAGRMAANDVIQTRLSVSNGEISVQEAENAVDAARLALLNLLSLDPNLDLEATAALEPRRLAVDLNRALEIAHRNNPTYLRERLSVETARTELLLARDNLRWQLDLTGGYTITGTGRRVDQASSDIAREHGLWNARLSLSVPLDMLELKEAAASTEVALEQAKLRAKKAYEDLDTGVRDAVRDVADSWERLLISRRSVELAKLTLDTELKKLEVGRSTNFEVLARQFSLQEAEVAVLNSAIDYLFTLVALDQTLGTTLNTWQIALNDD